MNQLYLALGGAGVAVIAAVVAYNAWQGAKVRRKLPRSMPDDLDTPVARMPGPTAGFDDDERPFIDAAHAGEARPAATETTSGRREPTFGGAAATDVGSDADLTAPTQADLSMAEVDEADEVDEAADAAADAVPQAAGADSESPRAGGAMPTILDRRIDCVVPIRLANPVSYDKLLPLMQRLRRAGSKPVFIEGHPEGSDAGDGERRALWEALQPGGRYDEVRVGVQLANRSGALNELEFSEFVSGAQFLADAIDGEPDFPDMMETVRMARELDGFAAQCDAQLSVNVRSDDAPWSANYVQSVAAQDGLLLSRDGTRFVKLDGNQNPVFMLQFEDTNFLRDDLTYKGGEMITLLLDVPVADEDILPFRLMCEYAISLARRIGAHLVDDQHRPLPGSSMLAIEKQLLTLYARLERAGIPAGSPVARRLFSN